jgi:aminomethyltransferase
VSVDLQRYTPDEMGLGRLVSIDTAPFIGRDAIRVERARGHARQVVGLEISWADVERHYTRVGLTPQVPIVASRVAVPVYRDGRQVGKATSTTWSPVLKKLIALATVDRPHFAVGTALEIEVTVEAVRHRSQATVVATPFYNPPQKVKTPPA